jgi:hypothetical protein
MTIKPIKVAKKMWNELINDKGNRSFKLSSLHLKHDLWGRWSV